MTRIALYPGSFDPTTLGHLDLIRRATRFADRLVVAVATNPNKAPMFTAAERLDLLRRSVGPSPGVEFGVLTGLLAHHAKEIGATILIRGLRGSGDFEYEAQMALMNRRLNPDLETVFLAPDSGLTFVSASLVREVARFGGEVSSLVPPVVAEALKARFAR
ncbi:MAG: pantetheine-phosphate adenylyltransferase [Gemmatimonadetes bacterium]|nr:pantetheine-phosphate adenylyltransferase [Gemmatimonadota bacterium]